MLWVARTRDRVTHATEQPSLVTGCGLILYPVGDPKPRTLCRVAAYIGLFRGLPAEVSCNRCRVGRGINQYDDGRDERGEEVAA